MPKTSKNILNSTLERVLSVMISKENKNSMGKKPVRSWKPSSESGLGAATAGATVAAAGAAGAGAAALGAGAGALGVGFGLAAAWHRQVLTSRILHSEVLSWNRGFVLEMNKIEASVELQ